MTGSPGDVTFTRFWALAIALFLLVAAPVSVIAGGDQLGAVTIALSGVGLAVLYLTVVLQEVLRAIVAALEGSRR